jgi:hypothetical protein
VLAAAAARAVANARLKECGKGGGVDSAEALKTELFSSVDDGNTARKTEMRDDLTQSARSMPPIASSDAGTVDTGTVHALRLMVEAARAELATTQRELRAATGKK